MDKGGIKMVSIAINEESIKETEMFEELSVVNIKLGKDEFNVYLTDDEMHEEHKKYKFIGENQYETVSMIAAMNKLSKFLQLTLDIELSKGIIKDCY